MLSKWVWSLELPVSYERGTGEPVVPKMTVPPRRPRFLGNSSGYIPMKCAHMNDSQDNPETSTTPTESEERKPQFSIGKILLWTAVVAGGLTVVKLSETNSSIDPIPQVLSLSFYTVVVCFILSLLRAPKSFDFWFPTGMNVFIPVFIGLIVLVREQRPFNDTLAALCALLAIGGLPYGIFLLVLNVRRIKRRDFSISILVYHLGSWLGWTASWTFMSLAAAGAFL